MLANKHRARASEKRSRRFHKRQFASNFLYGAYKSGTTETWRLVPCPFGMGQISDGVMRQLSPRGSPWRLLTVKRRSCDTGGIFHKMTGILCRGRVIKLSSRLCL